MPGVVIMLSLLYLIDVPNKLNRDFQIKTSDYEELPKVWSAAARTDPVSGLQDL